MGLRSCIAGAVFTALMASAPAFAQNMKDACAAMANDANAPKFAAIPEAPSLVQKADLIPAGGDGSIVEKDLPEICRVEGMITPTIGFLLRLPTKNWNGKFMMGGCGGGCGNFLEDRIDPALVRNYAVVTTDMGHKGPRGNLAYNTVQGQVDFGYRATHATAVAAKVLIEAFYGKKASRNYFWGCSTGGGQAMLEAQLYPADFEGILAGAPAWGGTANTAFGPWQRQLNVSKDGKQILHDDKLPLIHDAVMAACDAADGLKDGMLQNPAACKWDPKEIQCKGAAAANCLTAEEVTVVRGFYTGPTDAAGKPILWGLMARGSEDQWADHPFGGIMYPGMLGISGGGGGGGTRTEPWFRYARNPNLRPLKQAGAKLILYVGWNDNSTYAPPAIDYYDMATRTMGGETATKEFFRFFMLPAVNHCRYGWGGGEVDWVAALDNWVEKGQAPDMLIAYHPVPDENPYVQRSPKDYGNVYYRMPRHPMKPGEYDRTRPVFAYPDVARYSGKGDPNVASSWVKAPRGK